MMNNLNAFLAVMLTCLIIAYIGKIYGEDKDVYTLECPAFLEALDQALLSVRERR